MTSNGYFDYTQFKREFSKVIGISEDELYKLYDKSRKTLRKINIEKYEEHIRKLEENRVKTFMQKKEKIVEMLKLIPNHYDIIDYYINMQMEVDTFIKLCKDFITQEEQVKITIFFSTYINKLNNEIKFPTWKRIEKDMIVNNEVITVELEEFLLREMERLKIPTNYFILFLQKYKNGTLDLEQTKIKS